MILVQHVGSERPSTLKHSHVHKHCSSPVTGSWPFWSAPSPSPPEGAGTALSASTHHNLAPGTSQLQLQILSQRVGWEDLGQALNLSRNIPEVQHPRSEQRMQVKSSLILKLLSKPLVSSCLESEGGKKKKKQTKPHSGYYISLSVATSYSQKTANFRNLCFQDCQHQAHSLIK